MISNWKIVQILNIHGSLVFDSKLDVVDALRKSFFKFFLNNLEKSTSKNSVFDEIENYFFFISQRGIRAKTWKLKKIYLNEQ